MTDTSKDTLVLTNCAVFPLSLFPAIDLQLESACKQLSPFFCHQVIMKLTGNHVAHNIS